LVDHRKHALAASTPRDKFFGLAFWQLSRGAPFYGKSEGNPFRLFKRGSNEDSESMPPETL